MKDEKNWSYNDGGDAYLLKTWSDYSSSQHRWELPVGNYPGNSGNYHYSFFWVIFMVILHDFIFKNYHENRSDCYPFFRNGKLPDFFYKLPYYNFSDVLSKFIFDLRISKNMHQFFFQRVLE